MDETIERLTVEDYDACLAFLNRAFAKKASEDFESLLPVLYRRKARWIGCNYVVRARDSILALVGVFPIVWRVGSTVLRVAGVGGVSTDPDCRGRGLMRKLMTHCVAEMRREGYDLSLLGGQRQRYRYYGYERAGSEVCFDIGKANLRHEFGSSPVGVMLEPMPDTPEVSATVKGFHDRASLHCEREAVDFGLFLRNWRQTPWLARAGDGRVVGYVSGDPKAGTVGELGAVDDEQAVRTLRAWVELAESRASLRMAALPSALLAELGRQGEGMRHDASGNWQVFHWARVVDALLKVRHAAAPLLPGRVNVAVTDGGVTLALHVDQATAGCEVTDAAPDVSLDSLTAMRALFGPLAPEFVVDLPAAARILSAWCPLPLSIGLPDHV